jgi:hypothetical protein
MEKKSQKSNIWKPKSLKLNKETIYLLESSDLTHVVAGGFETRSMCTSSIECCDWH